MPLENFVVPTTQKLVSVAEMQAVEKAADAAGHSYATMMEIAGRAVADTVLRHYGVLRPIVLFLVGPGNNGGDGLVCARHLQEAGLHVLVYLWRRKTEAAQDAGGHFAQVTALGIPTAHADHDADFATLRAWLRQSIILVDALLGTGSNRPIQGQLIDLLACVAEEKAARPHLDVVAVDCASGLNCDTGAVDPKTIPATLTVTFAYAKHGHYQFPGVEVTGLLEVADIGVERYLADELRTFLLSADLVRAWLPARPVVSHKGTFGKAMAAVGCMNYPGAAYLSCAAMGRIGAGLVTGAVAQPVWNVVAGRLAEATWVPLPTSTDASGAIAEEAAPLVAAAAKGYSALLVGCGLGQQPTTQRFVEQLLTQADLPPLVIDADGLNALAKRADEPQPLPAATVLTPHPAELARLCNLSVAETVKQRWRLARQQAAAWNVILLAKGPYTVIAQPQGWLAVLPMATPALATAGTGDVLAGMISGLIAQNVSSFQAACLGAWLHGLAGQLCEQELGPAGVVASDLLLRLPQVMNRLRAGS